MSAISSNQRPSSPFPRRRLAGLSAGVLTALGIAIGVALSVGGDEGAPASASLPIDAGSVSATQLADAEVQLEPGDSAAPGVVSGLQDGLGSSPGGGLSIDELLSGGFTAPMVVSGYVHVENGVMRLCSGLAESFPPQCGGDVVVVRGIDPGMFLLESANGVSWSSTYVQVMGTLEDGELVATPIS